MDEDPGRVLSEARRQMVEQRRLVIKTLAGSHDREQMEAHINMMMKIQNAIDVLDRVSHEEHIPRNTEIEGRVGR
jgi:hypothetical protein